MLTSIGGPPQACWRRVCVRTGEAFAVAVGPGCTGVALRIADAPSRGVLALRLLGRVAPQLLGLRRGVRQAAGHGARRRTVRRRRAGRPLVGWVGAGERPPSRACGLRSPRGLAAGACVYLPAGRARRIWIGDCRARGGVRLRVDHVGGWPLQALLVAAQGAVTARAANPDPRRALSQAARDLVGYLTAIRCLTREGASALLGLSGDARLVLPAAGHRGPVLAEVGLGGPGQRFGGGPRRR